MPRLLTLADVPLADGRALRSGDTLEDLSEPQALDLLPAVLAAGGVILRACRPCKRTGLTPGGFLVVRWRQVFEYYRPADESKCPVQDENEPFLFEPLLPTHHDLDPAPLLPFRDVLAVHAQRVMFDAHPILRAACLAVKGEVGVRDIGPPVKFEGGRVIPVLIYDPRQSVPLWKPLPFKRNSEAPNWRRNFCPWRRMLYRPPFSHEEHLRQEFCLYLSEVSRHALGVSLFSGVLCAKGRHSHAESGEITLDIWRFVDDGLCLFFTEGYVGPTPGGQWYRGSSEMGDVCRGMLWRDVNGGEHWIKHTGRPELARVLRLDPQRAFEGVRFVSQARPSSASDIVIGNEGGPVLGYIRGAIIQMHGEGMFRHEYNSRREFFRHVSEVMWKLFPDWCGQARRKKEDADRGTSRDGVRPEYEFLASHDWYEKAYQELLSDGLLTSPPNVQKSRRGRKPKGSA